MMKKIIFTVSVLLIFNLAQAQNYDQEVDFGVRVAYDVTNYSEFKRSELPNGYNLANFGYMAGVFLQMRVNHFYFQPELLYNHVSTIIEVPLQNDPANAEIDMNFNSIQVPLILGYRTSFGKNALRFGGGIYFDFLMGSNGDFTLGSIATVPLPDDFLEAFNTMRVGSRFNVGFDMGPVFLDLAYQRGFSRLAEELGDLGVDFTELGKETTWVFSLGFKLISNNRDTSY